jgi:hypothetical protein
LKVALECGRINVVRLREWFKRRPIGVIGKELGLSSMKRMMLGRRMGEKGRRGKVLAGVVGKEQAPISIRALLHGWTNILLILSVSQ